MDERIPICYGCMTEQDADVCPNCGYVRGTKTAPVYLRPGTMLQGKYLIGKVIGHGGFGITYLALDTVLGIKLAVKEYFVSEYATRTPDGQVAAYENENRARFEDGIRRFLEEARILARFEGNPGIVSVRDFFRANGTAYLVMTYLEGMNLRQYLAKNGPMPFERVRDELLPVLTGALSAVHKAGMLHRDISPDNVFMTNRGQAKIIDFGAARQLAGGEQSLSIILKPGYAPEEQYRSRGHQGPWTDVYAVAATFYRAITGKVPAEALDRLQADILVPPSRYCAIGAAQEQVLLRAMSVYAQDRYPTMQAFCDAMMQAKAQDEQDDGAVTRESEPLQTVRMQPEAPRWQEALPREPAAQPPRPAPDRDVQEAPQEDEDDISREETQERRMQAAMSGAVKLIIALSVILLVLVGGYLLIRTLLNSLAQTVPPILEPTASAAQAQSAAPSAAPTQDPGTTPDPGIAELSPDPEMTPSPAPTAFPQTPQVAVDAGAAYGAFFADVTPFAPVANREYVFASGEAVGNLIYRTGVPEQGDVLVARFITDSASLNQGAIEIYFERGGSLYLYDQNARTVQLLLPANAQAGMIWSADGYRYEILSVAQTVTVKTSEFADCIVVRRSNAQGVRDLLYQRGNGLVAEVDDFQNPSKAYLRLRFVNDAADASADATALCTDAAAFTDGEAAPQE